MNRTINYYHRVGVAVALVVAAACCLVAAQPTWAALKPLKAKQSTLQISAGVYAASSCSTASVASAVLRTRPLKRKLVKSVSTASGRGLPQPSLGSPLNNAPFTVRKALAKRSLLVRPTRPLVRASFGPLTPVIAWEVYAAAAAGGTAAYYGALCVARTDWGALWDRLDRATGSLNAEWETNGEISEITQEEWEEAFGDLQDAESTEGGEDQGGGGSEMPDATHK